jgi:hypothetical protein
MQEERKENMETDIKSLIEQAQVKILQRLVDLAPRDKRAEASLLVEQFNEASRALSTLSSKQKGDRYAACQYPIDAIVLYLQDLGRPASRQDLVDGVSTSRWRPGKEALNRGNIKKSLKVYLDGQAKPKSPIKEIDAMVGLNEWVDGIFGGPPR